jgi:hypothetical protein
MALITQNSQPQTLYPMTALQETPAKPEVDPGQNQNHCWTPNKTDTTTKTASP